MSKTTVIIPTYNEAQNISLITDAIFKLGIDNVDLLIVDDDSPDGTAAIVEQLGEQYPDRVHLLLRKGRRGLGTAYIEGFNWAIERRSDYIIQMDADFSHSPEYLPKFLHFIPDNDVVVGSRYVSGGRLDERWGVGRRFLSWWANSVWIRLLLGLKTRDATAGFKCWKAAALKQIDLNSVRSNGYVFMVETCYLTERTGLRIKEIPIYFRERDLGESKMSLKVQIEAAMRVLEIRWRHRKR